jgi:hypothetical protein
LVTDWNLCQTGQIDKGEGKNVGRVNSKVDGRGRDAGIAACFCFCLFDDLISNLVEIVELLARNMKKLAPLISICFFISSCRDLLLDSICLRLASFAVDELKDEWPSGDNTGASR